MILPKSILWLDFLLNALFSGTPLSDVTFHREYLLLVNDYDLRWIVTFLSYFTMGLKKNSENH